ncbi:MAG: type II toxin-antitoxin system RelE/ParE family toxin [Candidatus Eisenbacteria bacterium]|nr:type II toxin-antitoxin system RelE/ParE family toxin [Candidatus Eisenbacteria bacterium]
MEKYSLLIVPSAVRELEAVPRRADRRRVVARIQALAADPRPAGCQKLTGKDGSRVRQGAIRVVYQVDDRSRTITVIKIGHRREVYR